jgi:hypothetical protein
MDQPKLSSLAQLSRTGETEGRGAVLEHQAGGEHESRSTRDAMKKKRGRKEKSGVVSGIKPEHFREIVAKLAANLEHNTRPAEVKPLLAEDEIPF